MIKGLTIIILPVYVIFLSTPLLSCKGQQIQKGEGTLKGTIGIYEGNCMPGPDVTPCEPRPISTTLYITKPSKSFNEGLIISTTQSNDNGSYSVNLKPGTYSLFIKDKDTIICDLIQCPDKCYCHLFIIKSDSTIIIDANLNHAAW